MENNFVHFVFSFGAGVQSTAILLLIKYHPDVLIRKMGSLPSKAYFADTGAEPEHVYRHLERMLKISPIPIEVVNNGSLLSTEIQNGIFPRTFPRTFPPYFTRNPDGSKGMLWRKCTNEFKIVPIERAIRRDIGLLPRQRGKSRSVGLWLGISLEECHRMTTNKTKLFENQYPLVELGWDRSKAFTYCQQYGITPPKSRCFFCPYINDWGEIKRNHPKEFWKAVEFDKEIRNVIKEGVKGEVFLHKSCKPLDEAIPDQLHLWQQPAEDDFGNECSGTCGV